jgi:biopolymer transport protein ExbB
MSASHTMIKVTSLLTALALSGSVYAAPQATSLDQLLEQVKGASQQNTGQNQQREAQFRNAADQQAQILTSAKQALAQESLNEQQLEAKFEANKKQLDDLNGQIRSREGDYSQVFDQARQAAGNLKTTLDASMTSTQYPGRGVFLAKLAESSDLPTPDDLHKLWFLMQQELTAEGQVAKFSATVAHEDGSSEQANVVRVGVFSAVNGNSFLRYVPETGALVQPDRQPDGHWRDLAGSLSGASGGVQAMAVDPSGGDLLRSLANQPSFMERVAQGHTTGWIIIVLGLVGLLIILERGAYLVLVGGKIKTQMGSSKADLGNPLGRILSVFNESKADDADTLGLRLDETLLRERPVIEARLGLLRILALVAVLLGILGTVAGVMNTFQTMNLFGSGGAQVAGGIGSALVPTWLGLLVAVILLFFHGMLTARSGQLMHLLEEQSASILAARAEKLAAAKAR